MELQGQLCRDDGQGRLLGDRGSTSSGIGWCGRCPRSGAGSGSSAVCRTCGWLARRGWRWSPAPGRAESPPAAVAGLLQQQGPPHTCAVGELPPSRSKIAQLPVHEAAQNAQLGLQGQQLVEILHFLGAHLMFSQRLMIRWRCGLRRVRGSGQLIGMQTMLATASLRSGGSLVRPTQGSPPLRRRQLFLTISGGYLRYKNAGVSGKPTCSSD